MILPELALVVGAASRLRCLPRLGMNLIQRQILVDQSDFTAVAFKHLLIIRLSRFTIRTLKILKLNNRDLRRFGTFEWSSIGWYVHAHERWSLQISTHLPVGTQHFEKLILPFGDFLLAQIVVYLIANLLEWDRDSLFVFLVKTPDLLFRGRLNRTVDLLFQ